MYTVNSTGAQLILGYDDVFREEKPDLIERISNLNMHKAISIISELIQVRNSYCDPIVIWGREFSFPLQTVLKKTLCGISPNTPEELFSNHLFRKDRHIISLQMMLILLKKIIIYGNYNSLNDVEYDVSDDDYKEIIMLQLIVADEINQKHKNEIDTDHFLYSTYHLNHQRNVANEFTRMFYMMECLSRDKGNFAEDVQNEYRDYYSAFEQKYGLSPTEYSSFLFWELNYYYSDKNALSKNCCWRSIQGTYGNTDKKEQIARTIGILQQAPEAFRDWATATEAFEWDFSKFMEFPFLCDSRDGYIAISEVGLINAFFEKIFWLIRDCYPKDDSRAMAFFGRLFEKYIQDATQDACNDDYKYIAEFEIVAGKKSSDAYVRKGSDLLVIEAKGFSVLLDCMTKNEKIEANNKKLFISPILQADKALMGTIDARDDFDGVENVYVISVTMDSINAVPSYINTIHQEVGKEKKCDKIKYYFNFSIEEYEMILWLLENGKDVFTELKEYFEGEQLQPFSNVLHDKYPCINMTTFMDHYFNAAADHMKRLLFAE